MQPNLWRNGLYSKSQKRHGDTPGLRFNFRRKSCRDDQKLPLQGVFAVNCGKYSYVIPRLEYFRICSLLRQKQLQYTISPSSNVCVVNFTKSKIFRSFLQTRHRFTVFWLTSFHTICHRFIFSFNRTFLGRSNWPRFTQSRGPCHAVDGKRSDNSVFIWSRSLRDYCGMTSTTRCVTGNVFESYFAPDVPTRQA